MPSYSASRRVCRACRGTNSSSSCSPRKNPDTSGRWFPKNRGSGRLIIISQRILQRGEFTLTCQMKQSVFIAGTPWFYCLVLIVAMLLAVASLVCALVSVGSPAPKHQYWKLTLYGCWVLGPPIWFFFEYFYFRRQGYSECFEVFKYGQDLASKIWVALSAILGYLFFGKEIFGKQKIEDTRPASSEGMPNQ